MARPQELADDLRHPPACAGGRLHSDRIPRGRGEPTWRDQALPTFELGATTQAEVLRALGPPSQLIALDDQVVFYYLTERSETTGAILILYNTSTRRITYDRAIFFFDRAGNLADYSYSLEALPYEAE